MRIIQEYYEDSIITTYALQGIGSLLLAQDSSEGFWSSGRIMIFIILYWNINTFLHITYTLWYNNNNNNNNLLKIKVQALQCVNALLAHLDDPRGIIRQTGRMNLILAFTLTLRAISNHRYLLSSFVEINRVIKPSQVNQISWYSTIYRWFLFRAHEEL